MENVVPLAFWVPGHTPHFVTDAPSVQAAEALRRARSESAPYLADAATAPDDQVGDLRQRCDNEWIVYAWTMRDGSLLTWSLLPRSWLVWSDSNHLERGIEPWRESAKSGPTPIRMSDLAISRAADG